VKQDYLQERDKYEKDHPELARKRRRISSQPPKAAAKTLPSPTASPAVDGHIPTTPAAKATPKEGKHSSKKEKVPKSDKKSASKDKDKDKDKDKGKKRRRKSEGK
jgi:hypothetical protein